MTIRPGVEWGTPVDRPDDLAFATGDAELVELVAAGPSTPLAVSAGDLHRSLGSPTDRPTMQRVEIDLLRVRADGREFTAVAHVIARRRWWHGRIVGIVNVDQLGAWNVAPRAHPNDGRFDVIEVSSDMTLRHRWQARSRLPQGTHVPHPAISTRTGTAASWTFDREVDLWVDGQKRAKVRDLEVSVVPDAFQLHV